MTTLRELTASAADVAWYTRHPPAQLIWEYVSIAAKRNRRTGRGGVQRNAGVTLEGWSLWTQQRDLTALSDETGTYHTESTWNAIWLARDGSLQFVITHTEEARSGTREVSPGVKLARPHELALAESTFRRSEQQRENPPIAPGLRPVVFTTVRWHTSYSGGSDFDGPFNNLMAALRSIPMS